jgi:hypothetical protein
MKSAIRRHFGRRRRRVEITFASDVGRRDDSAGCVRG